MSQTRFSLIGRLNNSQDHQAWEEFTTIYEPLLLRLSRSHGLQEADARDVCQQVLQAVAKDVDQWQPDGRERSFRRWLFQVARNRTLKFLEAQRRLPRIGGAASDQSGPEQERGHAGSPRLDDLPDRHESLSAVFEREYRQQLLVRAAEQIRSEFREATWEAFWRTCVEGISIPEAAKQLGMAVGSVYVARSRVTSRLKSQIQEALHAQQPEVGGAT